ncbi:MAG: YidC/Oxa1 family membrane protein insertase [bacterium]|nr:YidC/Oxa1 family membrane protein insertase [bacterium]
MSWIYQNLISLPFNTFIFTPLYNALVLLTAILPGHSFGLAVIILTLLVRSAMIPLSHRALVAQKKMRAIQPKLNEIKKKITDREEQARKMMELYREHGINPFSGVATLFIQIPIILGLYWVFSSGIEIDQSILYSFIKAPAQLNTLFLGIFELTERSVVIAVLVGVTQFIQAHLAMPTLPKSEKDGESTTAEEFSRVLQTQMKYVLPVFIGFVSLGFPSALALYWATGNIFSIGHELFVKRKFVESLG